MIQRMIDTVAAGRHLAVALVGALAVAGAMAQPLGSAPTQTFNAPSGSGSGGPSVGVPTLRASPPVGPAPSPATSAQAAAPLVAPSQAMPPLGVNDFQRFVTEATGRSLPLFGADFFDNAAQSAAAGNPFAPVSPDQPLGPGDEVQIRGWGSVDIDVRAIIDRNGLIVIPRVGTVQLAGVRAGQAEGVIRAAIGRVFRDFDISVTFGQLRAITIYVVGQARRPGTYSVSSMSSLVSGLFASGGPNANGSMRRVQLRRNNAVVTELDLYAFIAAGDKSKDVRLIDGDTILIPPALGHVALAGMVTTPAVYELRGDGETIDALLGLAGGLPVVADPRRAFLERLTPERSQPRSVEEFALDAAGLRRTLRRGDILTVNPVLAEFQNAVTLRGNVSQPVRMPWREGLTVRDLIPSREFLISRASVQRQGSLLQEPRDNTDSLGARIGNLLDEINLEYAVVERVSRSALSVELIPFNLGRVLDNARDPDNLVLRPGDVVTVFSVSDVRVPLNKRRVFVRVEGEVVRPGVYQMSPGDTLHTLVDKAGGLTRDAYLFGSQFTREEVRRQQAENLDRLIRRVEAETSSQVALISQNTGASGFDPASAALTALRTQQAAQLQRQSLERLRNLRPSGRLSLDLPASTSLALSQLPALRLESGDRLVVAARPDFVYVVGSVNTEAALLYRPGRTVGQYLDQAGVSAGADRDNVILIRADGTALTNTSGWSNNVASVALMPGDTLVVIEKLDRESAWSLLVRNLRDVTQIFFQLGLGAAAVRTLR
jgi:protein involved in polysaccharide export with SLBB domain